MDKLEKAIGELDLDCIKVKLMNPDRREGRWSREKADKVEVGYKRFLYLCVSDPDTVAIPNEGIDEFWHAHILDTQKYAEDCRKTFGFFLHHFPYLGVRGLEDNDMLQVAFRETSKRYFDKFGEPYSLSGSETPADCTDGSCGAGSCGPRSPRSFTEHLPDKINNDKYIDSSGRPKMAILELED
jgi:hypothetical protein